MNIFILGLLFALVIIPILDGLTSLILSFFEMIKSYFAVKITQNNQKMQEFPVEPTRKIGFSISEEEEVEADDL